MLNHKPMQGVQFAGGEAPATRQRDRTQPELCRRGITLYMDVRGLPLFVGVEEESVRSEHQDGWHALQSLHVVRAGFINEKPKTVAVPLTPAPG